MAGGLLAVTTEGGCVASRVEKADPQGGKLNSVSSYEALKPVDAGKVNRTLQKGALSFFLAFFPEIEHN